MERRSHRLSQKKADGSFEVRGIFFGCFSRFIHKKYCFWWCFSLKCCILRKCVIDTFKYYFRQYIWKRTLTEHLFVYSPNLCRLESIHYISVDYWITVLTSDRLTVSKVLLKVCNLVHHPLWGFLLLSLNLSNPLRKSTSKFCSNSLELTKYLDWFSKTGCNLNLQYHANT